MKKGAIVLTTFPFTDFSSVKRRPAIIISFENEGKKDVIIAFISSVVQTNLTPTDLLLSEDESNFMETGLHKTSVIKFDKIMTIEKDLLTGEIGKLPAKLLPEMDKKLKMVFGL